MQTNHMQIKCKMIFMFDRCRCSRANGHKQFNEFESKSESKYTALTESEFILDMPVGCNIVVFQVSRVSSHQLLLASHSTNRELCICICRIQYFQLFSWYSTVGLVLLTTFFLVIIPLIFLIEREIFRNL